LQDVCWPALRRDGRINVDSVMDFQSWALKKKLVDTQLSKEQFWDPSFVDYATRKLGGGE
jgi:hypothetical protein